MNEVVRKRLQIARRSACSESLQRVTKTTKKTSGKIKVKLDHRAKLEYMLLQKQMAWYTQTNNFRT